MSDPEQICHHVVMAASSRYVCCRLVQLLVPLQELLIAISQEVRQDDFRTGGEHTDPSIPPELEDFLDFVTDDKSVILKDEDWPYLD
jgi:hypothetical protein